MQMAQGNPVPPQPARFIQYIVFIADVQITQAARLRTALADASNAGRDIYLIISSGGGNVFEGMSIAAFMRTLPVTITTHNIGQTDSIANVIFAAGARRISNVAASFMFHGVAMHFEKQDFIESQLREQYEQIKRLRESIAIAFAGYTGIALPDIEALMISGGTILSAQEALNRAIIHEIRDANIPAGSQVIAIGNV
jgi:ATP-dependent protease ClpP protease subunit